MDAQAQEMEKDVFEPPVINPWRRRPSAEAVAYATDLCRSELTAPQRTIDRFGEMSQREMSGLIVSLKAMRAQRLRDAPRRRRLAPRGRRR